MANWIKGMAYVSRRDLDSTHRAFEQSSTMARAPLWSMVSPSGPLSGSTATLTSSQQAGEVLDQLPSPGARFTRGSSRSEGRQQAMKRLPGQPLRIALPTAGEQARRRRL